MFFGKEIISFISSGFRRAWMARVVLGLLLTLDTAAFVAIFWAIFLSNTIVIEPWLLLKISAVFFTLNSILGFFVYGYGRLRSLRAGVLFYYCVFFYFGARSYFDYSGKTISIWPWIIVWIVALWMVVNQLTREFAEIKNAP